MTGAEKVLYDNRFMLNDIELCLGQEEILAQLAEECGELTQAALKMRRVLTGKNMTPVSWEKASADLNEEMADVILLIAMVGIDEEKVAETINRKVKRWYGRLDL